MAKFLNITLGKNADPGIHDWLVNKASSAKVAAEFKVNDLLCKSCQKVLLMRQIDEYCLLQSSYQMLCHSSVGCELCYLILQSLSKYIKPTEKKYRHPLCKFDALVKDSETRIWAVKRFRQGYIAFTSEEPLAHLEIIVKRGYPGRNQNTAHVLKRADIGDDQERVLGSGGPPEGYVWGLATKSNWWLSCKRDIPQCFYELERKKKREITVGVTDTGPADPAFEWQTTPARHRKYLFHTLLSATWH